MKWWIWLIIGFVAGGAAIGTPVYFLSRCQIDAGGQVVIVDAGKTGPTTNISPEKPSGKCGDIQIDGAMLAGNAFGVVAGDECKHAERVFKLGIINPPRRWHIIQASYGPLFNVDTKKFRHSVDVMYYYSWERFAIGAGGTANFGREKLFDIGPRVGLQLRFNAK